MGAQTVAPRAQLVELRFIQPFVDDGQSTTGTQIVNAHLFLTRSPFYGDSIDALLMMGLFGAIAGFVTGRWSTVAVAFFGVLLLARYAGHGLVDPRPSWWYAFLPAASFATVCALGVVLRRMIERVVKAS